MLSVLDYKIIAKPNNSLSSEGIFKLLIILTLIALIVAVGFAHVGAWLVLPFAGLELVAFLLAFMHVMAHATDYESITIVGDKVMVEIRNRDNVVTSEFQRYWTQVKIKEVDSGKKALMLGSHGKEIEFGKHFINDDERIALMQALKQKLKNIN